MDILGEWVIENGMKINPSKSKAMRFMTAWVKNPLGYSLGDQKILEASSCKYLVIILQSDLHSENQVNYTVQKALKALHFVMCVLKTGNRNTKVTPTRHWYIFEYEAACWDPCKGQINALDRVQTKAAQFTNHTKDSEWETLA